MMLYDVIQKAVYTTSLCIQSCYLYGQRLVL